ncbi:unnamed protein product [Caenorhabditis bovis]|uniref:3-beta hydroxysteroid dehydrogenase/isomerase domain-containing protein n=1 Tax=Caenorhabditis bovis TaxID=2654633 RepID=A0A8S1F5X4_9PELO|nr:unnamed protein product [Caenorhabditis bovis]
MQQNGDPKRPNKIIRFKPVDSQTSQQAAVAEDPLPEYMNVLGMIFSMCGLMIRMKWCSWLAILCSCISFANTRSSDDAKQIVSSFMLSVSAIVMSYLQNPAPIIPPWVSLFQTTMFTVVVTGGSGLAGRYIVKRLLENEQIAEIRVIDKNLIPFEHNRVRCFDFDLNDRASLKTVLTGTDGVIHCAHSTFPVLYPKNKDELKEMWKDNLDATEAVIDTMELLKIRTLVNVGCAYCPIPNEDNFGLTQDSFMDYPKNYMLDSYGESRTRAEMYARKAAKKGTIDAIFLRPTFIYGQGRSRKFECLKKLIAHGKVPYISGDRRGLHQFIYAGNLAAIVEKSFFGLQSDPRRFNSEIVFCLDETCAFSMREFLARRFQHPNFSEQNTVSYWPSFFSSYSNYWKESLGLRATDDGLNHVAFRLFFEKTIGFPNKKLRLLLDIKPEINQAEAFAKYVNRKANFTTEIVKRSTFQG